MTRAKSRALNAACFVLCPLIAVGAIVLLLAAEFVQKRGRE